MRDDGIGENPWGGFPDPRKQPDKKNMDSGDITDAETAEVVKHCEFVYKFMEIYGDYPSSGLSSKARESLRELTERMSLFGGDKKKNYQPDDKHKEKSQGYESDDESSDDDIRDNLSKLMSGAGNGHNNSAGGSSVLSDKLIVSKLIDKLDGRRMPEFEEYAEDDDEPLVDYLKRFEDYCQESVKGKIGSRAWILELKKHIPEEMRSVCDAVNDKKDTYYQFKSKFLDYYSNTKDARTRKNKDTFKQAKYVKGESLYLFSVKLKKLFSIAYPNKSEDEINHSKKLINKLVKSVPKKFSRYLESKVFDAEAERRKINYPKLQGYAQIKDREDANKSEEDEDGSDLKIACELKSAHKQTKETQPTDFGEDFNFAHYQSNQSNQFRGNYPHVRNQGSRNFQNSNFGNRGASTMSFGNNSYPDQGRERNSWNNSNRGRGNNPTWHNGRNQFPRGRGGVRNPNPNNRGRGQHQSGPRGGAAQQMRRFLPPDRIVTCNMCGRVGHIDRECRACWLCGRVGHKSNECRNANNNSPDTDKISVSNQAAGFSPAGNQPLNGGARQMRGFSTEHSQNPHSNQQ